MINKILTAVDFDMAKESNLNNFPAEKFDYEVKMPAVPKVPAPTAVSLFQGKTGNWFADNQSKYVNQPQLYYISRPDQKRFFSQSLWNRNAIWKDPRYYDNEDLNAQEQSWISKLGNGLIKTIPSTAIGFYDALLPVQATNFLGGGVKGVYDNEANNALLDFQENMENWFPNYYTAEERNSKSPVKGLLPFTTGFGNFWGDKVFKNLGYSAGVIGSSLLQDAAITYATEGMGTIPATTALFGRASNLISKAFKGSTITSKLAQIPGIGPMVGNAITSAKQAENVWNGLSAGQKTLNIAKARLMLLTSAVGEASIEALDGSRRINEALINDYVLKHGYLPSQEEYKNIREKTDEAANIRFGLNTALLYASNAVQFTSLFMPMKSLTTGILGESYMKGLGVFGKREILEAGKLVPRELTRVEKAWDVVGSKVFKAFPESVEEGMQYSIENATQDYALKRYNNQIRAGLGTYMDSQLMGMKKLFQTKEGWENMIIGLISGMAINGMVNTFNRYRESRKGIKPFEEREQLARDQFNRVTEIFDENGLFNPSYFSDIAIRDGITFDSEAHQAVIQQQMKRAILDNDVFAFKSLQHELLFNMVRTSSALNRFESFLEKLDGIKNTDVEQMLASFKMDVTEENKQLMSAYIEKVIDKTKQIKKIVDFVDNKIQNPIKLPPVGKENLTVEDLKAVDDWRTFESLKEAYAFGLSHVENLNSRIPAVLQEILEANPAITEDLIDKMSDNINLQKNYINPLKEQIKSYKEEIEKLEETLKTTDLTPEVKKLTQDQLKEKKELLQNAEEANNKISPLFAELTAKTKNVRKHEAFPDEAMLVYKDLVNTVFAYEINKIKPVFPGDYKMSTVDDIIEAIIDLRRLKNSVRIAMDENNNLITEEGIKKFFEKYRNARERSSEAFLDKMKKLNLRILKKNKEFNITAIKQFISETLPQIEEIENLIKELKNREKELSSKDSLTEEETTELENLKIEIASREEELQDLNEKLKTVKEVLVDLENDTKSVDDIDKEVSDEPVKKEGEEVPTAEEKKEEEIPTETIPVVTEVVSIPDTKIAVDENSKDLEEVLRVPETVLRSMPFVFTPPQSYINFQNFLSSFRDGTTPNEKEEKERLNLFLEANDLQLSLISPPDEFYGDNEVFPKKFEGFEFGTETDTREARGFVLAITDKEGNPIRLIKERDTYKKDVNGDFIVSSIPTKEGKYLLRHLSEAEMKQEVAFSKQVRTDIVNNPGKFYPVKISSFSKGKANFFNTIFQPKAPYKITKKDINSEYVDFYMSPVKGGQKIQGFTIYPGELYIKIKNKAGDSLLYATVTLPKISEIKIGNKYFVENLKDLLRTYFENPTPELAEKMQNFFSTIFYESKDHYVKGINTRFSFKANFFKIKKQDSDVDLVKLEKDQPINLDNFEEAVKDLNPDKKRKLFGKKFEYLEVKDGKIVGREVEYDEFLIGIGATLKGYELNISEKEPAWENAFITFEVQGYSPIDEKLVPEVVTAKIKLVEDYGFTQEQADRMSSEEILQTYKQKTEDVSFSTSNQMNEAFGDNSSLTQETTPTPTEVVSDIEASPNLSKNVERFEKDVNKGWKMHLSIKGVEAFESEDTDTPADEIRSRATETIKILDDLKSQGIIKDYKIGKDGGQPGKNITVYIGNASNVESVVNAVEKSSELRSQNISDNLKLTDKTSVRFHVDGQIEKDGSTFLRYGPKGIGLMREAISGSISDNMFNVKFIPETIRGLKYYLGDYFSGSKLINDRLNAELAALEGVKPAEEVKPEEPKKRKKFDINIKRINPDETKTSSKLQQRVEAANTTDADIENVKRMFGENVNILNLLNIVNSDAWATWSSSAITLFYGSNRSDLYHEAWHHFSQLYLTKEEKVRLYNETRDKSPNKTFTTFKGEEKTFAEATDLEIEEYIARDFSLFRETGKIQGEYPERKSIFQKILDFLKRLFSGERDLSLNTLYNTLNKNKVNPLDYSTENIMFSELNSGINNNFSERESDIILQGIHGQLVKLLTTLNYNLDNVKDIQGETSTGEIVTGKEAIYRSLYNEIYDLEDKATNEVIKANLGRILDNWDDIKKYHWDNYSLIGKESEEDEINTDGEVVDKQDNDDSSENNGRNKIEQIEASMMTFGLLDTDGSIRTLLKGLTQVEKDETGKLVDIVDPEFGLVKLVDTPRAIALLRDRLSNMGRNFSEGPNNMLSKLNELAKYHPYINQLIRQLTLRNDSKIDLLKVKFVQVFGLEKIPLITAFGTTNEMSEENKYKQTNPSVRNSQGKSTTDFLKSEFNNAVYEGTIKRDEKGNTYIDRDAISTLMSFNLDRVSERIELYKSLGLNVDFEKNIPDDKINEAFTADRAYILRDFIINYLNKYGIIDDIVEALESSVTVGSKTYYASDIKNNLIKNLYTYDESFISNSFLNPEGNLESEVVLTSTMMKFFEKLNDFEKYPTLQSITSEDYYKNLNGFLNKEYSLDLANSIILNRYFNKDGTRKKNVAKIEIKNYSGLQTLFFTDEVDYKRQGKKTKDLFVGDKMISDIHLALNEKIYTTMQLGDKSSFFGIYISEPFVNEGEFGSTTFLDHMLGHLQDELDIIKKENKLKNLKKLTKNINEGNKFGVFRDIIRDGNLANDLITNGLTDKNKVLVQQEIINYFQDKYSDMLAYINKFSGANALEKYIKPFENKPLEYSLKKYMMNYFLLSVETSKLFFGNTYMHKDPFKRISGAVSTGRPILSSPEFLRYFNKANPISQRSAFLSTLNFIPKFKEGRKSDAETRFIVFKDKIDLAKDYKNYIDQIDKEIRNAKTPQQKADLESRKRAIMSKYSEVNPSDAMGVCTLDFWKKTQWEAGRWNDLLDVAFNKTVLWDKYNRLLKTTRDSELIAKYESKKLENTLTEDEMTYFTVQKYQYFGNVENPLIQEKGFHKFQLMPLIPQVIEGKLWEKHLERMLIEDVDYGLFESADKLEKEEANDFYNVNGSVDTYEEIDYAPENASYSYKIKTGYLEGLKEQVYMSPEIGYEFRFGSQIRKLIFNSFDEGVSPDAKNEDEFVSILKNLIDYEKKTFFEQSSIVKEDGKFKVKNKEKFIKFLKDEIKKKSLNKNVLKYLEVNQDGQFSYYLDTNLQRQPIESVFTSILSKRVIKQMMNGDSMVQVSSTGFEEYSKSGASPRILNFYKLEGNTVREMEVKVPLTGQFRNLLNLTIDGQKIGNIKRLNQLIREGKIDKKLITMIGYRIPTQEHNSIEVMQVQEFLDPLAGSMVVVPFELTAKAGSDFDIDKLFVFKPNIDKNGKYIEKTREIKDFSIERIEKLKEEIAKKKQTIQSSWDIQSTKLQKLYDERLSRKDEVSQNIEELKYSLRQTNIEIAFLKEDILILKDLSKDDPATKDMLLTMFSAEQLKGKSLDDLVRDKEEKINQFNKDNELRKSLIEEFKSLSKPSEAELKRQEERRKKQDQYVQEYRDTIEELKAIINYKKYNQNRIIEIIKDTLLQPRNFINLITPNSTFMFDEPIARVIQNFYTLNEDYVVEDGQVKLADVKLTKMFLPQYNWDKFKTLYEAKKALGIAATANVFSQLLQRANVNFTEEYLSQYRLGFKVGKLSSAKSSNGQSKATAFSQLINLYVDIANDPRAGYANMGTKVTPIINLLVNLEMPVDLITFLINQPIVRDYVNLSNVNRSIVQGKVGEPLEDQVDRNVFNYLISNTLKDPSKYPISDPSKYKMTTLTPYVKAEDVSIVSKMLMDELGVKDLMSLENLLINMENKDRGEIDNKIQMFYLTQFMQLELMARDFFSMQRTLNFDTTAPKDAYFAWEREQNYKEIQNRNIFTNLDVIKNDSVISPFEISEEIIGINKTFLPLMNNEVLFTFIKGILDKDYKYDPISEKERFVKLFKNDLISYIFQNYLEQSEKGMEFFKATYGVDDPNKLGFQLLKELYKDFNKLKQTNPELFQKYSLLSSMYISLPNVESEFVNIGLSYFAKDSSLQDSFIEQYNELLKNESQDVRDFMSKFALMSFYQSGITKSSISSGEILPISIIGKLLNFAREEFSKQVDIESPEFKNVLDKYYKLHKKNNNLNPKKNILKIESFRAKNYSSFYVPTITISENVKKDESFNPLFLGSLEGQKRVLQTGTFTSNAKKLNVPIAGIDTNSETFEQFTTRIFEAAKSLPANSVVVTDKGIINLLKTWDKYGRSEQITSKFVEDYFKPSKTEFGEIYKFNDSFFVVHGESEDDVASKFPGKNTELTKQGNKQALEVGKELAKYPISQILTSDTQRGIETANIIAAQEPEVEEPTVQLVKGAKVLFDEDVEAFKLYLSKSIKKPNEFFTSKTKFKEFFNPETGRREKAPQTSKWLLQDNGLYYLTDLDSGEIYITNVDLETGFKYEEVEPTITPEVKSTPGLPGPQAPVSILPTDKIIWGHPTIGKSYLKEQGEGRFITLDDDYKDEVNAFVDANRGSETRQEYKGRKPKEYNEFMLNLFDRLKKQAQAEGKMLFVSNTNILKERMKEFDKVITMPKAEFKKRFDERGATYGFEDWKSDIDATVAKVPVNKVITTSGYLSELLPTKAPVNTDKFAKKNIFTVTPQAGVSDNKAKAKASIATQYIGFGEGIRDMKGNRSSTEIYREQAGEFANTGSYSSNDIIFVSIPGKRGREIVRKEQQDKTIAEAIKALEAGATILTDNKAYIDSSDYNEGEKRLYEDLDSRGYKYSEITIDDQVIGTWSKPIEVTTIPTVTPEGFTDITALFPIRDEDIKNSKKYKDFAKKQLMKNPRLTEEQILKLFKECK